MKTSNTLRNSLLVLFIDLLFIIFSVTFSYSETGQPTPPDTKPVKTGTVTGIFVGEGSMEGGQVVFYSAEDAPAPNITKYIRVPMANLTCEIQPDGSFLTKLPVGKYYMTAIKRHSGQKFGMPQKGDYYYRYYKPNTRELQVLSVREGERIDLGFLETQVWQGKVKTMSVKTSSIEGTLKDKNGNPVENALVLAYNSPEMIGKRAGFISSRTGKDGKFILKVPGGNLYFLMARGVLGGGQLQEDEIIGFYGGHNPVGISLEPGKTAYNITITVDRQAHRGPSIQPGEEKSIDLKNIGSRKPSTLPENSQLKPPPVQNK